jgi:hypothetical protein
MANDRVYFVSGGKALEAELIKAFEKTCDKLCDKMTEIIEREGAYSPPFPADRDIVDTRDLLKSQHSEKVNPYLIQISYNVDYALLVHEGYTKKDETHQPGRPWMIDAVDELDMKKTFEDELSKLV